MARTETNESLKDHPLAPYLEGEMVDYYGDTRYAGEYPDVPVRFSMDVRRAGNNIIIKGYDLKSFYVEFAEDDLKEWIDSRQEMARQTLEQAKDLKFGPEEPYFFTKPGEFVFDSAIRWDLGKDRYAVLRPDTSNGWLLESCANITSYVADAFYDSDVTHGEFHVKYPHKHGVERTEIKGEVYIDINDPYGNGARMLRDTERFVREYNILPELSIVSGVYLYEDTLNELGFDYKESTFIREKGELRYAGDHLMVFWPEPEPCYTGGLFQPRFQSIWGDRYDNVVIEAVQNIECGDPKKAGATLSQGRLTFIYPNLMTGVPEEVQQIIDQINQKSGHTKATLLEHEGRHYGVRMDTMMKDDPANYRSIQDSKTDKILAFDFNRLHDFGGRFGQVIEDYLPELCRLQDLGKNQTNHQELIKGSRELWIKDADRYLNPETNTITSNYVPVAEVDYYANALQLSTSQPKKSWLNVSDLGNFLGMNR